MSDRYTLGKQLEDWRAHLYDGETTEKVCIGTFFGHSRAKSTLRKLNAHDVLMAALRGLLAAAETCGTFSKDEAVLWAAAEKTARDALLKAETKI